ncbi:MAG: hypothetical protein ABL994_12050, partial [Verrucomicrobiales bacterium]
MSESEIPNGLLNKPRGRKLRRIHDDVLSQHSHLVENAPDVDPLHLKNERPYLERARQLAEARSARMAREEAETPVWEYQPEEPSWTQGEESSLTLEEQRRLAEEERPHWSEIEEERLVREEKAASLAKEEARLAQEREARLAREREERLVQEEAFRLRREREGEARLAREEEARLAREQAEKARLERNAEAERLAREAEAVRLAQAEAAHAARAEAERFSREAEAARLAKEEAVREARRGQAERVAKQQAEDARIARQRVEQARMALGNLQIGETKSTSETVDEVFTKLQAMSAGGVESVSGIEVSGIEEAPLVRSSFVPSASREVNRHSVNPGLPLSSRGATKLPVPAPVTKPPVPAPATKLPVPAPEVDANQLLDDEKFDLGQRLLERQFQRLEKEIQVAKKHQDLLKEKARIRRKEEFNLGAWLAGAGPADLRECSDSERQKVCAIGYTVLV